MGYHEFHIDVVYLVVFSAQYIQKLLLYPKEHSYQFFQLVFQ
jgi:hypothetical protein